MYCDGLFGIEVMVRSFSEACFFFVLEAPPFWGRERRLSRRDGVVRFVRSLHGGFERSHSGVWEKQCGCKHTIGVRVVEENERNNVKSVGCESILGADLELVGNMGQDVSFYIVMGRYDC